MDCRDCADAPTHPRWQGILVEIAGSSSDMLCRDLEPNFKNGEGGAIVG